MTVPTEYDVIDFDLTKYSGSYPRGELIKAKKQIYQDMHVSVSQSLLEISIKRKCGVLTKDVRDFKMHNKTPGTHFNNDMDYLTCRFDNTTQEEEVSAELAMAARAIESQIVGQDLVQPPCIQDNIYKNPLDLCEQKHLCEQKFCARNLECRDELTCEANRLVFVCDMCFAVISLEENMKKHLQQKEHFSASEYFMDEANMTVQFVKARSSICNLAAEDPNKYRVFCPKCHACFDNDVAACGMHFKTVHYTRDEYLYSFAERIRTHKVRIEKRHSCPSCNKVYNKLKDLVAHLETTGHFPQTHADEINVYECPFDKCSFSSISYFYVKQHLLSHPFFNMSKDTDMVVDLTFSVYGLPDSFLHIAAFRDTNPQDRKQEVDAINGLLDLLKGHNDSADIIKKLKARKDFLIKLNSKKRRSTDD